MISINPNSGNRKLTLLTMNYISEYMDMDKYLAQLDKVEKEFNNIKYGVETPIKRDILPIYLPKYHRCFGLGGMIDEYKRRKLVKQFKNDALNIENPRISNLKSHIQQLSLFYRQISLIILNLNGSKISTRINNLDYITDRISDSINGYYYTRTNKDKWLLYGAFHWYKLSEWIEDNKKILYEDYKELI